MRPLSLPADVVTYNNSMILKPPFASFQQHENDQGSSRLSLNHAFATLTKNPACRAAIRKTEKHKNNCVAKLCFAPDQCNETFENEESLSSQILAELKDRIWYNVSATRYQ